MRRRCSDWAPCRRFLLGRFGVPFPQEAGQVLEYLEAVGREGAARTTQSSLLSSLRFLEEAGEVPEKERLSADPALANAAKEAKARLLAQGRREGAHCAAFDTPGGTTRPSCRARSPRASMVNMAVLVGP